MLAKVAFTHWILRDYLDDILRRLTTEKWPSLVQTSPAAYWLNSTCAYKMQRPRETAFLRWEGIRCDIESYFAPVRRGDPLRCFRRPGIRR